MEVRHRRETREEQCNGIRMSLKKEEMLLVSNLQTSILRTTEKHFIVFGINI